MEKSKMASSGSGAAFAVGTSSSVMNVFVQNCWVVGTQRVISEQGDEEFLQVRTEMSDRSVLHLHRTAADLGALLRRLGDAFPGDGDALAQTRLLEGLGRIREAEEASNVEGRLQEVERLLRNTINMPWKYSRSEAVLSFFEPSPLDQLMRQNDCSLEPLYHSPVTISDIMRSNGFCLANTETVFYDLSPQETAGTRVDRPAESVGSGHDKNPSEQPGPKKTVDREITSPESSVDDSDMDFPDLTYYQLVAYETDILE